MFGELGIPMWVLIVTPIIIATLGLSRARRSN
jgi:hypothetical protein